MTLAHYGVVMLRPYMDQLSLPPSNADRYDLMPSLRPFLGRDVQSVPCDGDAIDVAARGMLDRHPGAGVVVKFMLREKRLPLAFIDPDGTFEQSDEYGGKPERIPVRPHGGGPAMTSPCSRASRTRRSSSSGCACATSTGCR